MTLFSSIRSFFLIPVLNLWSARELVSQFTRRTILQRTQGSFLGVLWQLLQPLLMMSLYTVVFGVIFQGGFSNSPESLPVLYGIGIYIGLNLLGLINESIGMSPLMIISEPGLVKKVVFPLEIIPLSGVAYPLCQTVSGLILSSIFLMLLGIYPTVDWLFIPVIVIPVFLLAVGLSWMISSISVYVRDLTHLMNLITQVMFWTSGIFFNAQMVQEYPRIWMILKWNPILLGIDELRSILLWNSGLHWNRVFYLYVVGIVFWTLGFQVFSRLRQRFADVM